MNISTQNDAGQWVPAIPLPLYLAFGRCRCSCGVTRWGMRRYREHYALAHIVDGKPPTSASVHDVVTRGLPPRGGYPSGPTPVRGLPKAPTGPAPGSYRAERTREAEARGERLFPPRLGSLGYAEGGEIRTPAPHPAFTDPNPKRTMHFDAGGEDTVACGAPGFSTYDRLAVTCTDCLRVMMVSGGMEPTLPGTVMVWPRRAALPEGWRWANGDLLRRAAHPGLAEAIGNQFARPHDERVLMVRLPDFRDPRTGACTHIIRVDPRV